MAEPNPNTIGMTVESMRLTYPARFQKEKAAERFIEDNRLWQAGVKVAKVDTEFRIVIDSYRCHQIVPWLRTQFPGAVWTLSRTP